MQFERFVDIDLRKGRAADIDLGPILYEGDSDSMMLGVRLHGEDGPVDVSGSVSGWAILPTGETMSPFDGKGKDGNAAWIIVPQDALVPGRIEVFLRITDGDEYAVTLHATATVRRTQTGAIIVPGDPLPNVDQMRDAAQDCIDATEAAEAILDTAVSYNAQTGKTDAEKATARQNIGAAATSDLAMVPGFKVVTKPVITDFEKGSLAGNPPAPSTYAANARMRAKYPIVCEHDLFISINTATYTSAAFIFYLYADDMATASTSSWVTSTRIPAGTAFKLLVSPNPSSTTNYSLDTIFGLMTFAAVPSIFETDALTADLFENGNIADGINSEYGYRARVRTSGILRAHRRIAVAMDTGTNPKAAFDLFGFDNKGQYTGQHTGWATEAVIEPGACFRLVMTLDNTSVPSSGNAAKAATVLAGAYIDNNAGAVPYPVAISHQGKTDGVENYCKLEGYIKAAQHGFRAVETDIKRTSDGVIVCSHDSTFVDATSGDTITLAEKTLAELKACDYYGGTIATLDELLAVCKRYGMELYLDQLGNAYTSVNWNTMFSVIRKYGYIDRVWFICYNDNEVGQVLQRAEKPRIAFAQAYAATGLAPLISFANSHAEDCGEVAVNFYLRLYTEAQITEAIAGMNQRYKANAYPFDTVAEKRAYAKYMHGGITNTNVALYPAEV